MVILKSEFWDDRAFVHPIFEKLLTKNLPKKSGYKQDLYRKLACNLLDKYFFIFVSKLKVNEFYECGAHDASASINFKKMANGKSIAIEANPYTFESKTSLASYHGVVTLNLALGAKNTKSLMFIDLANITSPATSLLSNKSNYKKIQIPMSTLSNIVKKHSNSKSILALWIDVEGSTFNLLAGAAKIFNTKDCRIIKIEMETEKLWSNQKTFSNLDTFLRKYNFVLVCRDIQRSNQFNAVYVKYDYMNSIKNEIDCYWDDFLNLKLGYRDYLYLIYGRLHELKLLILKLNYVSIFVHVFFFLLGSKSSREYLKKIVQEIALGVHHKNSSDHVENWSQG